jgi:glutathione synthase/RimK-type ligase-like ATP-grasp enzyme
MTTKNLLVLNNPAHWRFTVEGVDVISAKDYLTERSFAKLKHARVFNLCRSYRYQSVGYYVSLLAAARGHRAIPTVATMQDFRSQTIVRAIAEDVDERIQRSLNPLTGRSFSLHIYFGQTIDPAFRDVGKALYNLFQAPLLKVQFAFAGKWLIQQITPLSLAMIPEEDQPRVEAFASSFFARKRFHPVATPQADYDLAILINPAEAHPPSCKRALRKFEAAAGELDIQVEFITREDYNRLAEFDMLFIRETTAVNHHTYRFARRAHAEGLVVIDDPWSILRCANKVFLAERLALARIPAPKTVIIQRESFRQSGEPAGITFPCVIKQPDSAFSQGVLKAANFREFQEITGKLFEKSDLLIAQEFMASAFDWRVGILDGQVLYVCKYYMAKDHWQICNWARTEGHRRFGKHETIPVEAAPQALLQTALKASGLIGDGLYGVDLKEIDGKYYVIEINDNPSIDAGIEDSILKDQLYLTILRSIRRRFEGTRM